MLELRMAVEPCLVLKTPWWIALSTFSHAPITTLEHARTSLYQQLPASRSGLCSNKKELEHSNLIAIERAPTLLHQG